jgi:hypothetical protein
VEDLTGKEFGFLKVLHYVGGGRGLWKVKCKCGTIKEVDRYGLTSNHQKSCGKSECRRSAGNFVKLPNGVSARNKIVGRYKRLAKRRNLPFKLSIDFLDAVFSSPCHYCGVLPSMINTNPGGTFTFNGIDRKDPNKGYTKFNVVPCCKPCNWAKGLMPYEEFTAYLNKITSYRKNLYPV